MNVKDIFYYIIIINYAIGAGLFAYQIYKYITLKDPDPSILFILACFGLYGYILYKT